MAKIGCFESWNRLRFRGIDLRVVLVLLAGITLVGPGASSALAARRLSLKERRKQALMLLQRADRRMDIRFPGSAPFRMKVTFQALPPLKFPRNLRHPGPWKTEPSHPLSGHPWVITGSGTYEEVWLSPHRWRREVTFGKYHAVEAESNGVRKFQASSSYEPLRVLMLMGRLLQPIRRLDLEPQIRHRPPRWKISSISLTGARDVRISYHSETLGPERFDYIPRSYVFLPNGALARSQGDMLTTRWQDYTTFGGKLVPQRLTVSAMGHALLTARISVTQPRASHSDAFVLPGRPANPGETLRPIPHQYLVKGDLVQAATSRYRPVGNAPSGDDVYVQTTFTRGGEVGEYEVIAVWPLPKAGRRLGPAQRQEARHMLTLAASQRARATTVDGYPCEVLTRLILVGSQNLWPIGLSP